MDTETNEQYIQETMMQSTTTSPEAETRYSYEGYQAAGGRIDEANYLRVMKQAREVPQTERMVDLARAQTKITADISEISLDAIRDETGIDPRTIYGILRRDEKPADVAHHHTQMSDQQLLVESLRMLEQGGAVQAIIAKHPHISFS